MLYLLSNICTKIIGIEQLLLKSSLEVGWYPFLRHSMHALGLECDEFSTNLICSINLSGAVMLDGVYDEVELL